MYILSTTIVVHDNIDKWALLAILKNLKPID